jgi:5-methylcytosine-specific restriction endonuclease McrA
MMFPKPKRIKKTGKEMETLRREVFERDHGRCQDCGKYVSWDQGHLAHVKSRGAGGDDVAENCLWKCFDCHIGIEHGVRWKWQE